MFSIRNHESHSQTARVGRSVLLICRLQLPDYIIYRQPPVVGEGNSRIKGIGVLIPFRSQISGFGTYYGVRA